MKLLLVSALLFIPTLSRADDGAVYRKCVGSVVGIISTSAKGETWRGTGVVVSTSEGVYENRAMRASIVVTAAHCITNAESVEVILPIRDNKGDVIGDRAAYLGRGRRCVVMKTNHDRDLALLGLVHEESVEAIGLSLGARAGEQVFTIGAGSGIFWHFASGNVRQVYQGSFRTKEAKVSGKIVEMTVPINPGDSGGPVISLAGKLVGINLATEKASNQIHQAIDGSEVVAFLSEPIEDWQALAKQK
jgi:S1-C subfamily serine protease